MLIIAHWRQTSNTEKHPVAFANVMILADKVNNAFTIAKYTA